MSYFSARGHESGIFGAPVMRGSLPLASDQALQLEPLQGRIERAESIPNASLKWLESPSRCRNHAAANQTAVLSTSMSSVP